MTEDNKLGLKIVSAYIVFIMCWGAIWVGCAAPKDRTPIDRSPVRPIEDIRSPDDIVSGRNFFELYNQLYGGATSKLPTDKAKHADVSKGLFHVQDPHSESAFFTGLEALMLTLEIGMGKELKDVGASPRQAAEVQQAFDRMLDDLEFLDRAARTLKLDQGDLLADGFGAGSALILYFHSLIPGE